MSKDESAELSYHENKSSQSDIATPPSLPTPPSNLVERLLKPKVYFPRYPKWMIGKRLLWATCFFGSLGDALFGYDQGIMSGLLVNEVFIRKFYHDHGGADGTTVAVNPSLIGITVACLQLSAAIGSLLAGYLGDVMGRKRCVRVGGFLYLTMAFLQAFAPNLGCFIAGRTIQGLGVGFLSMTVPVIQTEIAAPHRRGLMVGVEYTFLIGGYMLSCWVDYGFNFLLPHNTSWQGPYFVQMVLAFILFSMSFFLPETPRWLARNGFTQEALQTLADLHSKGNTADEDVQHVFLEIQEAVHYEDTMGKVTYMEMFTKYRKRTIVGITAQMFAQLNGINVISFYLPSSLAAAGFTNRRSLLFTAANAIIYTSATVPVWWLADRWGRRPLLIFGGIAMAIALSIVCVFQQANGLSVVTRANGMYSFVVVYNALYGATWGPMPWLLPAEIFPLRARSKGMALATFSNWTFNFIIGMSSPDAFAGIKGYYYIIIAGFCLFSVGLAKFYYVETANHTLEEVAVAFGDKAFLHEDEEIMASARLDRRVSVARSDRV
ncbi:probable MFS sugar transporter [Phialocephala subalpina]|uniref:Probable MFS sugar transporter n=1 Tax=Phialocephala subalpina TaxID=576137 RepID=A0A1L7XHL3_9HELO|nr:probable MFS sugar transporter [Phialocephala subalpina]